MNTDSEALLDNLYLEAKQNLIFLKTVEYDGDDASLPMLNYSQVEIDVRIYRMCHNEPSIEEVVNTEVTLLPNAKFEGFWDRCADHVEILSVRC